MSEELKITQIVYGENVLMMRVDECLIFGNKNTLRSLAEKLTKLPSAEPEQKWIPVTEALPKDAEFVLLIIRRLSKLYDQTPFISVGFVSWNQNVWWCAHDGDCDAHNVEVLAWMPLPEPYKGVTNE